MRGRWARLLAWFNRPQRLHSPAGPEDCFWTSWDAQQSATR